MVDKKISLTEYLNNVLEKRGLNWSYKKDMADGVSAKVIYK